MTDQIAPKSEFVTCVYRGLRDRGVLRFGAVAIVYLMIASATFSGFYDKWGLRDGNERYALVLMLDGDAHRPFVYRQFLPMLANGVDAMIPPTLEERIVRKLSTPVWWEARGLEQHIRVNFETERDYVVRYYIVYYACVGFLFLALFVLRQIGRDLGLSEVAATIAPPLFGLCIVYFSSMGGFFYDFPEVFFLALAFLLAWRNQILWLFPVTILATCNKEAFLIFTLALFPIFLRRYTPMRSGAIALGLAVTAGVTYLIVRSQYGSNAGGAAESWFIPSLHFYADLRNLFAFETNFGVVTPRAYSLFSILILALLFAGAWRSLDQSLRRHALLALALNAPLVLAFAGPGEFRNFSLCYIAIFLAIALNVEKWTARSTRMLARSAA